MIVSEGAIVSDFWIGGMSRSVGVHDLYWKIKDLRVQTFLFSVICDRALRIALLLMPGVHHEACGGIQRLLGELVEGDVGATHGHHEEHQRYEGQTPPPRPPTQAGDFVHRSLFLEVTARAYTRAYHTRRGV